MSETITRKRGDDWIQTIACLDSTGDPLPIQSVRMQLRNKRTDELALTATSEDGQFDYDEQTGDLTQTISAELMETLAVAKYKADIQFTYTDGTIESTDTFIVKIIEDITRDDAA